MQNSKQKEIIAWFKQQQIDPQSMDALVLCFELDIQDPSQFEAFDCQKRVEELKDKDKKEPIG
jgi:hypothetical protein